LELLLIKGKIYILGRGSYMTVAGALTLVIVVGLFLLSAVSFTLFIRRILINTSYRRAESISEANLERKLDRIIELLEEKPLRD